MTWMTTTRHDCDVSDDAERLLSVPQQSPQQPPQQPPRSGSRRLWRIPCMALLLAGLSAAAVVASRESSSFPPRRSPSDPEANSTTKLSPRAFLLATATLPVLALVERSAPPPDWNSNVSPSSSVDNLNASNDNVSSSVDNLNASNASNASNDKVSSSVDNLDSSEDHPTTTGSSTTCFVGIFAQHISARAQEVANRYLATEELGGQWTHPAVFSKALGFIHALNASLSVCASDSPATARGYYDRVAALGALYAAIRRARWSCGTMKMTSLLLLPSSPPSARQCFRRTTTWPHAHMIDLALLVGQSCSRAALQLPLSSLDCASSSFAFVDALASLGNEFARAVGVCLPPKDRIDAPQLERHEKNCVADITLIVRSVSKLPHELWTRERGMR